MIKNYIKTAFRNLVKNKGFTVINVLGLALGLAACMLIFFYVFDELDYDRYNEKADRIYRINNDIKFGGKVNSYAVSPAPMAAALKADLPEVEQVVRFRQQWGALIKKGDQEIKEFAMTYVDPSVFSVFTLPMIDGNPAEALKEPHTIVITERMAKKYFNRVNVTGQVLTLNDTALYKITGVIKDMPQQSHFNFDFFLSMSTLAESKDNAWLSSNFNTYVLLRPGADRNKLEGKFPDFFKKRAGPQVESILHLTFNTFEQSGNYIRLNLTPLTEIHLHSNRVYELGTNGSITYVYIFLAMALFILLIACVNFINLSTARSSNRAREVGVRKVLGSPRKYLIAQFLTESVIITFFAALIALIGVYLLLPWFNNLADKELLITPVLLLYALPVLLVLVIVLGCLAGLYPALFLSAFKPIEILKGKLASGFKGGFIRSFLVVFQFAISIFLIIGTLVIYDQLKYIQNKDLGYNRSDILVVHSVWTLGDKAIPFKHQIKSLANVENATLTGAIPTMDYDNSTTFFKDAVIDQKRALTSQEWSVDEDYIKTLGIKMISGRGFQKNMATDSAGLIINEAAAKLLSFSNPVGQPLYAPGDNSVKTIKRYQILGVMKDFNFKSLRDNVTPMVFTLQPDHAVLSVRVNSANMAAIIAQIEVEWKQFSPNQPFTYSFMDKDFDELYRSEQRIGIIFTTFSTLAIIIACLGLFGMATYAAEQRVKEIGIRKVMGATVVTIAGMLSIDFIRLVFIAILVASPLAWWAMNKWLQGFAYRIHIQWWVIAGAGVLSLLIAIITISFQAIKAAIANPVKSLRSE